MPQFYTQNHGSTVFNERIERLRDVDDELNCREELAVMRSVQLDRVTGYSQALEHGDAQQVTIAGMMASEQAKEVILAAERIGKHEKTVREHITPELMRFLAQQVFNLAYEVFGEKDQTTDFVAQAEAILCNGVSPSDVSDDDLLQYMGGVVPLVSPENLAQVQGNVAEAGDPAVSSEEG